MRQMLPGQRTASVMMHNVREVTAAFVAISVGTGVMVTLFFAANMVARALTGAWEGILALSYGGSLICLLLGFSLVAANAVLYVVPPGKHLVGTLCVAAAGIVVQYVILVDLGLSHGLALCVSVPVSASALAIGMCFARVAGFGRAGRGDVEPATLWNRLSEAIVGVLGILGAGVAGGALGSSSWFTGVTVWVVCGTLAAYVASFCFLFLGSRS